jgi:(2Fe-2S) ferredoxin
MQEPYIHDRRVNTSTMKRVVKELHNKGELIDWERTGVTRVKQVTIKRRN